MWKSIFSNLFYHFRLTKYFSQLGEFSDKSLLASLLSQKVNLKTCIFILRHILTPTAPTLSGKNSQAPKKKKNDRCHNRFLWHWSSLLSSNLAGLVKTVPFFCFVRNCVTWSVVTRSHSAADVEASTICAFPSASFKSIKFDMICDAFFWNHFWRKSFGEKWQISGTF